MTKLDLERELKGGKKLVDLFTFTGGQECEICYTVQDFIRASQGHENVARALFVSVDWQHPNLTDFLLGYEEEDFREAFGFAMDDLEA